MALTSKTNGSQTATLATEHTLATVTDAGVYQLVVDAANLANGETLTLRLKTRARSGDTTRLAWAMSYRNVQGEPILFSLPIGSMHELVVTLEQTSGTGRAFPWNLLQLQ